MKYNVDSIIKKLLIKYPDFSDIINNTKFIEDYNIETACTDGKDILYNPNFIKSLSKKQQLMVLAHEVCHIALDHINRLKDKNMELWNIATDAVINANLEKDGCELFDGCVQIKDALEYDSEELYEKLLEVYKQKEKEQKQQNYQNQQVQQVQQGQQGQQEQQGQDGQQDQQSQQSQQGQQEQQSQQSQQGQQEQQGQDGQQDQQGKQGQQGQSESSNSKNGKQSIDDIVDSVLNQKESSRVKNHGSWSKNKNSDKDNSGENSDDISETKNNDSFEDENINNNDLNDSESEESKSSSSSSDKTTSDSSKSSDKKSKDNEKFNSNSDDSKNKNSDKTDSDSVNSNEDKDKSDSNSVDSKIDNKKIENKFKDRKKEKDKSKSNNDSKENNDSSKEYSDSDFQEKYFEKSDKDVFEKNRNDRLEKIQIEKEKLKQQLMEYGQGLSNTFGEGSIGEIGDYGQPIDWRRLLRESITRDVDWTLRNAEVEDGIVLSRLEEFPCSETEIVLDTSGSVSEDLLRNFLRECKNILRNSKIKVGCFDTRFYGFEEIKTMEDIENFKFRGFGGTDFNAAVNAFSKRVDNRIVFTDGYAPMPDKKVKAIWLVYGDGSIRPDGGKVIHITPDMLNKLNGRSRSLRR